MLAQHLLDTLKHGYTTHLTDADGSTSTTLHPPNKYMLAASKAIEQLLEQLGRNQTYMEQLQNERDEAITRLDEVIKELETAKNRDTGADVQCR